MRVPASISDHKGYYEAISETFDATNDQHTSNVASVCYESYDPDIYVNKEAKTWTIKPDYEKVTVNNELPNYFLIDGLDKKVEIILKWFNKKFTMSVGNRNTNLFKLACALNEAGMTKDAATSLFLSEYSFGLKEAEVHNVIKSAYSKVEKFGTMVLKDTQRIDHVKQAMSKGSSRAKRELVKEGLSKDDIDDVLEYEYEEDYLIFWDTNSKTGAISLNDFKFKLFLENRGFFKVQLNEMEFTFVKVRDNIIKEVNETIIKDFILNYVEDIDHKAYNFFAKSTGKFTEAYLNMLETRELSMLRDTADKSYLFFQNIIVEVTQKKVNTINYIDCGGLVWERNIIKRDYVECRQKNDFEQFIVNVTNGDSARKEALQCAMGYLLTSFKKQNEGLAIVLYDETLNDNPDGRTGKTLISKALSQLRKLSTLNGKQFNQGGDFAYQTVTLDDNILCFDDLDRNFKFEEMFSVITGDLILNKKGIQAIVIPYERSPKILFTSNYILSGVGSSHEARKVEIELFRKYSSKHQPIDDFGKQFFSSDWTNEDWNSFYSYMIQNIQEYFAKGLIRPDNNTTSVRKVISSTNDDFFRWCEEYDWKESDSYKATELMSEYESDKDREVPKTMNSKWFGRWLTSYFEYKKYGREDFKSNQLGRYFRLTLMNGKTTENIDLPF